MSVLNFGYELPRLPSDCKNEPIVVTQQQESIKLFEPAQACFKQNTNSQFVLAQQDYLQLQGLDCPIIPFYGLQDPYEFQYQTVPYEQHKCFSVLEEMAKVYDGDETTSSARIFLISKDDLKSVNALFQSIANYYRAYECVPSGDSVAVAVAEDLIKLQNIIHSF